MRRGPQLWLVAYDIRDPARGRRVHRVMRGFGDHTQFSVFRCILSDLQVARLKDRLVRVLKPTEDQVILVPLGSPSGRAAKGIVTLGVRLEEPERVVRIIGP
jgi:CRISPR-associated protein Cas2